MTLLVNVFAPTERTVQQAVRAHSFVRSVARARGAVPQALREEQLEEQLHAQFRTRTQREHKVTAQCPAHA